jgi:hypothetical protein
MRDRQLGWAEVTTRSAHRFLLGSRTVPERCGGSAISGRLLAVQAPASRQTVDGCAARVGRCDEGTAVSKRPIIDPRGPVREVGATL